jgi:hypothetical protein
MATRSDVLDYVNNHDDWTMFADGFEDAILGVEPQKHRVIYSVAKCYDILMTRDGMERDVAEEFFAFNVLGSLMGEKAPIWCFDIFD